MNETEVGPLSRRNFLATMSAGALAVSSGTVAPWQRDPAPTATTDAGVVRGTLSPAGVAVFRGVPYAASTEGRNRFRPPAPVTPWTGVRDALEPGAIAPQNDDDRMGLFARYRQGEDCLNLNVWTPALDGAKRPVVVFMHGGGFTTGAGSLGLYDGTILAKAHDVVVVTINYRLGILGFPPFQLHGSDVSSNLGVLDAMAALGWVQRNIAAFGGDPARVLQCGQSAGAMISAALGVIAEAAPLYQRAAPFSMQALVTLDRERQARFTHEVLAALGLGPKALPTLASLPVADLLRAQDVVRAQGIAAIDPEDQMRWPFSFNHDDVTFRDDPATSIAKGRYRHVPTLIGATTEELLLSPAQERANPTARARLAKDGYLAALGTHIGAERATSIWSTYRAEYPDASELDVAGLMETDRLYRIPALRIAESLAPRHRSWSYAMAYRGTGPVFKGAHHAIDLPFWFGALRYPQVAAIFLGHEATPEETALSGAMQRTLVDFARDGRADWAPYDAIRRTTKRFNLAITVESDPQGATRKSWEGLVR